MRTTLLSASLLLAAPAPAQPASVIFIHPDGASAATWTATRALVVGPDAELHWDRLPEVAVYKGHLANSLTSSSNGGATAHATGIKPGYDSFGRSDGGVQQDDLVDENARLGSAAIAAGLPTGLVQTGIAAEPGTACFVVGAPSRGNHHRIAADLIASNADVLMSGGESHFLPEGTDGVHGPGRRTDGRNLINEAEAAGYTVVRTREELLALASDTDKVLGLFAADATFNALDEQTLLKQGLEPFDPDAPTVGEMTDVALRILHRKAADRGTPFFLVVEEEGTDNLGNKNHAAGTLEAARRADAAIGVALDFVTDQPDTLVITAADSDGGGLRMKGFPRKIGEGSVDAVPDTSRNGAPMDGVAGPGTAPFLAAPDAAGNRLPFGIAWTDFDDVSGGIVVRAAGAHADRVRGTMSNTDVSDLMRSVLFDDATE